jgi:hypothetical protein
MAPGRSRWQDPRMGLGISGSRLGALALAMLAAVALCAALATDAGAAKLVGKDGKVYACYKAKGKTKGAVRLVTKKGKCKHGEKKISWNSVGPAGESGTNGESGSNGENGTAGAGEKGATGALEGRMTALTNKVTSLESILSGITNTDLLGMLSKLQGISGTQLQETVASLADAKALCAQASVLTSRANELTAGFGGLSLNGILTGLGGILNVPVLAGPLPGFSCP